MKPWSAPRYGAPESCDNGVKTRRRRPRRRAAVFLRSQSAVRMLPELLSSGRISGRALKAAGKARRGDWRPRVKVWLDQDRHPGLRGGAICYFRSGGGRLVRLQILTFQRGELKTVLGKAFRGARLAAGLSRENIRELTGVALSEIAKIERLDPRANPTLKNLGRLARAVNRPLHELLTPE